MKKNNQEKIVNAIEQAQLDLEKDQPSGSDSFGYYQHALLEEGFVIVPLDVLHQFFNHKSDANKYLEATQQEDLETEFHDYLIQ